MLVGVLKPEHVLNHVIVIYCTIYYLQFGNLSGFTLIIVRCSAALGYRVTAAGGAVGSEMWKETRGAEGSRGVELPFRPDHRRSPKQQIKRRDQNNEPGREAISHRPNHITDPVCGGSPWPVAPN